MPKTTQSKSGKGTPRCMGGEGRGMGMGRQGQGRGRRAGQAASRAEPLADTVTKVAVSSEGPTLSDRVDPRFGRAGGFAVVDLETMNVEYLDNGSSQAMAQGAGIQAAETVANAGAQVLLTGYVGPKAHAALTAAGIRIGQDVDGMTVEEAVNQFRNGAVTMAEAPNAQGGGRA